MCNIGYLIKVIVDKREIKMNDYHSYFINGKNDAMGGLLLMMVVMIYSLYIL